MFVSGSQIYFDGTRFKSGDSRDLDLYDVLIPSSSRTGKSLVTFNQSGFDVLSTEMNWVTEAVLGSLNPDSVVLDIGAAFGALTRASLEKGATVISNDVCFEHLLYARAQTPEHDRSRLYLNNEPFPDISLRGRSLTHAIAHRVVHFLPGETIARGFKNTHDWLRPQGIFAVVAMCAEHVQFRDAFFPGFITRRDADVRWPGEWLDVGDGLPDQRYALPPKLHVFDIATMKRELEAVGFKILQADYVSLRNFGDAGTKVDDDRKAIGLIAQKT